VVVVGGWVVAIEEKSENEDIDAVPRVGAVVVVTKVVCAAVAERVVETRREVVMVGMHGLLAMRFVPAAVVALDSLLLPHVVMRSRRAAYRR
jgi:hypothetical protein